MNIFSYDELKKKACREIERLNKAEQNLLDEQTAIDHALNAAFSIYHLIQWGQNAGALTITNKARDYVDQCTNQGLKILHDVVTCNKHVTVSKPAHKATTTPRIEDNIVHLTTQDGSIITTENGRHLITEGSNIKVYFGNLEALAVLVDAMTEFK